MPVLAVFAVCWPESSQRIEAAGEVGHTTGMLPRVILHSAVSLDGRVDWFHPDVGAYYRLASRLCEDATLAGSQTVLESGATEEAEDAGAQDTRGEQGATREQDTTGDSQHAGPQSAGRRRPLLLVADSRGRVECWPALLAAPYWRGGVAFCSQVTPAGHLEKLRQWGVEALVAGAERVDLRQALEEVAARHGVQRVRVDSGGTLGGVLLRAGLVHEVSLLIHPRLVGGSSVASFFRADDLTSPDGVIATRLLHVEELGADLVWLRYQVVRWTGPT
jgi:2,5-diamino-6-(ribosylamino)-4(3H)-pyrimidinone 5'-phosphate reductase